MQEAVPGFFGRVISLRLQQKLKPVERVVHLLFTIHAFQSLESEPVRAQVAPCLLGSLCTKDRKGFDA